MNEHRSSKGKTVITIPVGTATHFKITIEEIADDDAEDPRALGGNHGNFHPRNMPMTNDVLTTYDWIVKFWPANTINIFVKRLTGSVVPLSHTHTIIESHPRSSTELFDALKSIHGAREEAEYELKFCDVVTGVLRGLGRVAMPDTRGE